MAKPGEDLRLLSINQLCGLTGKTFRTIKKRLEPLDPADQDGNTLYYRPPEALQLIYAADAPAVGSDGMPLDLTQERARLAKAQADKVELEVAELRKILLPAEKVEAHWTKLLSAFRQKVRGLPTKSAPKIAAAGGNVKEIERVLKKECEEALSELSGYDPSRDRGRGPGAPSGSNSRPAADPDGQPVG